MRLISWNCQMAFRKKADRVLSQEPDILIVAESEHPSKIEFSNHIKQPFDTIWVGDNQHKGLLIASYRSEIALKISPNYSPNHRYIVPVNVNFGNLNFCLLAVWTKFIQSIRTSYVVQVNRAIADYKSMIDEKFLSAGDFNSNSIWNNDSSKESNHGDLIKTLSKLNIHSLYHQKYKETHGEETRNTYFMHRDPDKGFHID